MSASKRYIVALRYTKAAGGYEGVITWSSFTSKAEFNQWLSSQDKQEVVEENITTERGVELTRQTPASSYLLAALQDATLETGEVMPQLLKHGLSKAFFAITGEVAML